MLMATFAGSDAHGSGNAGNGQGLGAEQFELTDKGLHVTTISVYGLGYVGAVATACLADGGDHVIGVDINPAKTDLIARGNSPIQECGIEELLQKAVRNGLIQTTTDPWQPVLDSDVSMVCVGTPSSRNGNADLSHLTQVCRQIGEALQRKREFHVIALRSTVPPGTTESILIPLLEETSGKKAGRDFGVCFNPEFLREGTAIQDFYSPPFTVLGTEDARAADTVAELYARVAAPVVRTSCKTAEMLKYVSNAFHALKVCFANEIGNVCQRVGVDSHELMTLFCMDKKLNISEAYLKPGFAFGGSCLPKDIRGLLHLSRHLDLAVPVLESILPSNQQQIELACEMVTSSSRQRIGICGFAFKPGTDDLRESPMVKVMEFLLGKGYQVKVYDEHVSTDRLHGANRAYIEQAVPHI